MIAYLLYYDLDSGDSESWNTFYTPCEVFLDPSKRQKRIDELKIAVDTNGRPQNYSFYEVDLPISV